MHVRTVTGVKRPAPQAEADNPHVAFVAVRRASSGWRDRLRRCKVLIDGRVVGRLGPGEFGRYEVAPGHHVLAVAIDWKRSPSFEVFGDGDGDAGHVSTAYIPLRPVPYPGPPGADNEVMQPRFGIVTRVIAAVFALAGIGAAMAMLGTGDASDRLVLLPLAAGFLVLAVGLWAESTWAWWAGADAVVLTVLLSRVLNVPGGAGLVWLGTVVGFVVSEFQGWRDQVRVRPAK